MAERSRTPCLNHSGAPTATAAPFAQSRSTCATSSNAPSAGRARTGTHAIAVRASNALRTSPSPSSVTLSSAVASRAKRSDTDAKHALFAAKMVRSSGSTRSRHASSPGAAGDAAAHAIPVSYTHLTLPTNREV